jgi:hypothetical protein
LQTQCQNGVAVWTPFENRWRRIEDRLDAIERDGEELREFMREVYVRYERSFGFVTVELKEMSDQVRENTAATWAVVERLGGSG